LQLDKDDRTVFKLFANDPFRGKAEAVSIEVSDRSRSATPMVMTVTVTFGFMAISVRHNG
jgi:hypothetical protein